MERWLRALFRPQRVLNALFSRIQQTYSAREVEQLYEREGKRLRRFNNAHEGERCFIIGTGPSLNDTNVSLLRNETTFGVNTLYTGLDRFRISWNYYCVSDKVVWRRHWRDILELDTKLFLSDAAADETLRHIAHYREHLGQPVYFVRRRNHTGYLSEISKDIAKGMYWGGTVIIDACLQIAYYMGFKDVYLLGCDCDYSGMHRFDGSTTEELNGPGVRGEWEDIFEAYRVCGRAFEERGGTIVNCTVGGKLEVFDRMRLEDVL